MAVFVVVLSRGEFTTVTSADLVDPRLTIRGGPAGGFKFFDGGRAMPMVHNSTGCDRFPSLFCTCLRCCVLVLILCRCIMFSLCRRPRASKGEHPLALASHNRAMWGHFALVDGGFALYKLDGDAAHGVQLGDMGCGKALYDVRSKVGFRGQRRVGGRAVAPIVLPSVALANEGRNLGSVDAGTGSRTSVGPTAFCVRDALLRLPAVQEDPALLKIADDIPEWATMLQVGGKHLGLRGKHTRGHPEVRSCSMNEIDVAQIDPGKQYLLRPCGVGSDEPEPHCIAATGGELIDGDERRALSADGLADLGYSPVLHSGLELRQVPTKASRKADRKRKFTCITE